MLKIHRGKLSSLFGRKRKIVKWTSICCLGLGMELSIASISIVQAQTVSSVELTLSKAIDRAEANNPQLLAARSNVAAAEAGLRIAGANPTNPRLSFDRPFGQAETKRTIGLEVPVELGGKKGARLAVARSQLQQARLQLASQRWTIRNQARQAYVELAIARGNLQQIEETLAVNQRLVDVVKLRLQAGDVAESDLIQSRFALAQATQKLEPARSRIRQAVISLNSLLGQPLDTNVRQTDRQQFRFSGQKPQLPATLANLPQLNSLQQTARRYRTDLALAQQQVEINQGQLRLARANQIPDLTGAVSYIWDPSIKADAVSLGVRVDLPIFNLGRGQVNQAEATIAQANNQLLALQRQITQEVATAYQDVVSTQRVLESDRTVLLPQAREVLNLALKNYRYGQTSLTELLTVQQSVSSQFESFYTDIANYQQALGKLEQAIARPILSLESNSNAPNNTQ